MIIENFSLAVYCFYENFKNPVILSHCAVSSPDQFK